MKKDNHSILFYIFVAIFITLAFLRSVLNINIPTVIFTIIISLYLLVSKNSIAELIALIIPFRSILQGNYIIFIAAILYLISKNGKVTMKKNIILLLVVLLVELFNCFNPMTSIKDYITFATSLLFMYIIIYDNDDSTNDERVIKNNIFGIITSTYMYLFRTIKAVDISRFITYKYRLGVTDMENSFERFNLSFNVNEIGLYAIVGLSLLLFLKTKNKIKNSVFYICFVLLLVIGFLTMSRAFMLGLILLAFFFLLFNKKHLFKVTTYIPFILILLFCGYQLNNGFFDDVYINYKDRFEEIDITNGRNKIFAEYNRIIFSSPKNVLLGSGIQKYSEKNNFYISAHNSTQEIFVAWGIIGGISFILLLVTFILERLKRGYEKNKSLNKFLPMIMLMFMIQTIPFFSQGIIILQIFVVLVPLGFKDY